MNLSVSQSTPVTRMGSGAGSGRPRGDWTDERVTLMKSLWAEGRSATQIANVLGPEFTRNAVIGKVNRLGLQREPKKVARLRAPTRKRVPKVKLTPRFEEPDMPSPEIAPVSLDQFQGVGKLSIMDLHEGVCRFPFGDDPPFLYCGEVTAGLSSYCPHHHQITHSVGTLSERKAHLS